MHDSDYHVGRRCIAPSAPTHFGDDRGWNKLLQLQFPLSLEQNTGHQNRGTSSAANGLRHSLQPKVGFPCTGHRLAHTDAAS